MLWVKSNKNDVFKYIERISEGDFECIEELANSQDNDGRKMYKYLSKLVDTISNIKKNASEFEKRTDVISNSVSERAYVNRSISTALNELAKGATQQAMSAEKCIEDVSEFQSKFEELSKSSKVLAEKANTIKFISGEGHESILEIKSVNKEFESILNVILKKINELSEVAKGIYRIIDIIVNISGKTTLLALNASIEAARAGESGKGFAVVANEIGKLAEQSKNSSADISKEVSKIVDEISVVSDLSKAVSNKFGNQTESINKTTDTFTHITDSLQQLVNQQANVCGQVNEFFNYKDKLINRISDIVAVTEESSATTQELSSIAMEQTSEDDLIISMITELKQCVSKLSENLKKINIIQNANIKRRFAIICLEQQEFYKEIEEAAVSMGKKLDIEIVCKTPEKYNPEEQINIFKSFVTEEFDGIGIVPSDPARFKNIINDAVDRGVKVVCIDIDVPDSKRQCFITSDSYNGGMLAGKAALKQLKEYGKVMSLLCASDVPTVQKRYEGFREILAQNPKIQIIRKEEQKDTNSRITRRLIEDMITKNPDFDLLYLVNSSAGEIACDIWKEKKLNKNLIVLSKDSKIFEFVKQGIVTAQIVQRNNLWGEIAVKRLYDLINDKNINPTEDTGMYEINKLNINIFDKSKADLLL